MEPGEDFLNVDEVATYLGVTTAGVKALVRGGHLATLSTLGKPGRFRVADVARLRRRRDLKTNRYQRIPSEERAALRRKAPSPW